MIRSIHWVTVPEFKVLLSLSKHLTVCFQERVHREPPGDSSTPRTGEPLGVLAVTTSAF